MTPPRFLTPRRSLYTRGPQIAKVSNILGRPPLPWQVGAADLIGECDYNGNLINPLVVITVPRQAGKTALMHAVMTHRLTMRRQARAWYTAQTGIKAREQMWEMIEAANLSPLAPILDTKVGAGDTSITIPRLGSRIRAHPPTVDSLHGAQSDLNVIDEGWFYDAETADGLMGAITPTQSTRPGAQTIVISTAGTAASVWFHDLVEQARAGEGGVLIDYGVAKGTSADDFEAIAAAHPAIGHTQDVSILASARAQMSEGEFLRAYGNLRTKSFDRVIPLELETLATADPLDMPTGAPVFGAAVSFERDDAVIVAAVPDADGVPWCEIVHRAPTADGMAARLAELTTIHGGHVTAASAGPIASVAEDADRIGATITRVTDAELSASTADILDRLRRPTLDPPQPPGLRLAAHPVFSEAFEVVATRTSGDRVSWSRRGSAGSIAAIEAMTLAVRAVATKPRPPVAPMIWSS